MIPLLKFKAKGKSWSLFWDWFEGYLPLKLLHNLLRDNQTKPYPMRIEIVGVL
jgi:hypothetical protein